MPLNVLARESETISMGAAYKDKKSPRSNEALAKLEQAALRKIQRSDYLWFVVFDGALSGPHSVDKILSWLESAELSAFDFCWRHGFQEWRPIASVADIAERTDILNLKNQEIVDYPPIPAPYRKDLEITLKRRYPHIKEVSPKVVKVRMSKVQRREFAIGEWLIAFFLALFLAVISLERGLSLVKEDVEKFVQIQSMGHVLRLGEKEEHLSQQVLDVLKSAPGYKKNRKAVPVRVEGRLEKKAGEFWVSKMALRGAPKHLQQLPVNEFDPVYSKRAMVYGQVLLDQKKFVLYFEDRMATPELTSLERKTFFDCFHNRFACF